MKVRVFDLTRDVQFKQQEIQRLVAEINKQEQAAKPVSNVPVEVEE